MKKRQEKIKEVYGDEDTNFKEMMLSPNYQLLGLATIYGIYKNRDTRRPIWVKVK